jgi:hypothetical protein
MTSNHACCRPSCFLREKTKTGWPFVACAVSTDVENVVELSFLQYLLQSALLHHVAGAHQHHMRGVTCRGVDVVQGETNSFAFMRELLTQI